MQNRLFSIVIASFLLSACVVTPVPIPQSKMITLARMLDALGSNIKQNESIRLSQDIFLKTSMLTKEFKLTSPPLWHNTLVNLGLRQKGLCYHWSDALYVYLKQKDYTHFSFHLVGANIGSYFKEHNALVITAKGKKIEDGIIVDPWRDSGKLYFSKVNADEKYSWSHRLDRGCK